MSEDQININEDKNKEPPDLQLSTLRKVINKAVAVILLVVSLSFHLVAIGIIYKVLEPIISWYLTKSPIRGIDTFLSAVYVNYILKWHDFLRPEAWKYIWFGGYPFSLDYPSLYFLAMTPFVNRFGLISGVMHFAAFGLVVFAISSYFFYHELSKNRSLALVLTIATILSANLYRALVWAGGIPFWTTQAFYPLVGFLIIKALNSRNAKWFYLAAIAAGLGLMGHPQGFLNVIFPFCLLVLIFYSGRDHLRFRKRLGYILTFFGLSFLVGLPGVLLDFLPTFFQGFLQIFATFGTRFGKAQGIETTPTLTDTTGLEIIKFTRDQFNYVFSDTQQFVWFFLSTLAIVWCFTLIYRNHRIRGLLNILPFTLFFGYEISVVFLFSRNIDIYIGGWYKAFWSIPVATSALVAVFFGQTIDSFLQFEKIKFFKYSKWPFLLILNMAILVVGYLVFPPVTVKNLITRIDSLSNPSSPYPDILNIKISTTEREELKQKLVPKFLDPNDKNQRLYVIDATVNLWWTTMYEMPLARGYVDPPIPNTGRWGLFWLDSVMGPSGKGSEASLILDWETPENVVFENTKFLLDWNSIYYILGNYSGDVPTILAKHVTDPDYIEKTAEVTVKGAMDRYNPSGERFEPDKTQSLIYYKVRPELVSPILTPSNATPVLLIGDSSAYDTIYRYLGMKNLNSQKIIVSTRSKFIDDHTLKELKKFDAVIIYRYDYHRGSKAWKIIGDYLKDGGKVYIDTGPDVKEAASNNLPEYFPFRKSVRGDIGRDWNVEVGEGSITKEVDFNKFSPLIFDGGVWNVSHPEKNGDLNSSAEVLLRNNGKVVAASMNVGSGKLSWTGFNLPYHVIRDYNEQEANFLTNILDSLVDFSIKNTQSPNYQFISPERRVVQTDGARAVLFKEEAFPSWVAKTEKGQKLTVYKAGPTYPGYVYVPFSSDLKPSQVILSFNGALKWWIYHLISLLTLIFLLDRILTGGHLLVKPVGKVVSVIVRPTKTWWQKEDEE